MSEANERREEGRECVLVSLVSFSKKKFFFEIWMKKVLETVWVSTPYMLKEENIIFILFI